MSPFFLSVRTRPCAHVLACPFLFSDVSHVLVGTMIQKGYHNRGCTNGIDLSSLNRFRFKRKAAFQNHKLLPDRFFVESDGEGPRSKIEREDGQTDSIKMTRVIVCNVSGVTSPPCKVT